MKLTKTYLKEKEWSMGHNQCPECSGVPPEWHGHPLFLIAETIGHKHDCPLAKALVEVGETPIMIGNYKSPIVYECYWNTSGLLSTRIKV